MKHQEAYDKEIVNWERYVNTRILPRVMASDRPTTSIGMAKMLVEEEWIVEVQKHAWKIAKIGGYDGSLEMYKNELMKFKTYEGKTINAWKNSYERKVGSRMMRSIKTGASTELSVLKVLDDLVEVDDIKKAFKVIAKPTAAQTKAVRMYEANPSKGNLVKVQHHIKNYIKYDALPSVAKSTVEKVNIYQGKRLFKDQLQKQNNIQLEKDKETYGKDPKLIMIGTWKLSPSHPWGHMDNDPCEEFAVHDAGYGPGTFLDENIPIPVQDTHFACGCEVEFEIREARSSK